MTGSTITPDQIVLFEWGFVRITATLAFTWLTMAVMVLGAWLATRRIGTREEPSRAETFMEVTVEFIERQIEEISDGRVGRSLVPFVGTLFLFIAVASVLGVIPGFIPPTGSLSTTVGLAIAVFVSVPVFGVLRQGIGSYLHRYIEPTPFMLPFNILSELSRTIALAIRLFGNVMSTTKLVAIVVGIVPLVFPLVFNALGLLTGVIQAYIFAILATVYITSGIRTTGIPEDSNHERS
ncbi:MAG: F0F1 ATP synthase subunit A [Actinomycetota bacterium]